VKLKPTAGRIAVKELDEGAGNAKTHTYSPTGTLQSEPGGGELCKCEVLEVGPTPKGFTPPGVKKGDVVLVRETAGDEVEVDGEDVCIISPYDIVAKVE
jgi:co-chaperonin GroES (HSP10)